MNLCETVDGGDGVYRIFQSAPAMFLVLDHEELTVDEFKIIRSRRGAASASVMKAIRYKRRQLGAPDLANSFAAELSSAVRRH